MLQLFSCQLIMTPKTTEKRVHFKWLLVLKIIIDTTVAFIAYLYQFFFESTFINTLIIYLGMYAFSCLSYLFIFDATFKDAIYVTSIGYVFQHIAYKCNSLIFDTGDNLKIQSNAYQGIYPSYSNQVTMISDGILLNYLINILEQFAVYMLIDLILYFIFAKKFKRNYVNTLSSTYTITISITSLLITILLNTFFLYSNNQSKTLSIIVAVLTILVCLFILYNCSIQMELSSSKKEKILLENQYKEKINQYELSKESVNSNSFFNLS